MDKNLIESLKVVLQTVTHSFTNPDDNGRQNALFASFVMEDLAQALSEELGTEIRVTPHPALAKDAGTGNP